MELPAALRQAVEEALTGVPVETLVQASAKLTERYRAERQDGNWHISNGAAALAYLAARLPATYAAVSASFAHVVSSRPDFTPRTLLDVGAGPGTVLWAASQTWPSLQEARLLEASPAIRHWGERLSRALPLACVWQPTAVTQGLSELGPCDLVTASYLLSELTPDTRANLLRVLWAATRDVLVLVEPGTPAGWERILNARSELIAAGAHMLAPCPHAHACPLQAPAWCHFSQRVARSRTHLRAKGAEVGWEDEKFSYLAVSRQAAALPEARVLATPRARSGLINLKLCQKDGSAAERLVSKREGDTFKRARRLSWGDPFS